MALWTLGCGKQPHPSIRKIICLTAEIVCPILFLSLKEGPMWLNSYIGVSASRIRVWDHISSHLQEADYFIVFEDDEV